MHRRSAKSARRLILRRGGDRANPGPPLAAILRRRRRIGRILLRLSTALVAQLALERRHCLAAHRSRPLARNRDPGGVVVDRGGLARPADKVRGRR